MQRAILHISLLAFGTFYAHSFSTLIYVLPIWSVSIWAASRNKNNDFDIIDMFWLLNQLSFVVAPLATLREPAYSTLFSGGAILPMDMNKALTYQQDQVILLYFIIFIVTVINAIILPHTYRYERPKNSQIRFTPETLLALFFATVVIEIYLRGGLTNTLAPRRLKDAATGGDFLIFAKTMTLALSLFLATKLKTEQSSYRYFGYLIFFGLLAILYNPFNVSRFELIQAQLPVLLITFPILLRFKIFSSIIILGMMIVMPIMSVTSRRGLSGDVSNMDITPEFFLTFLDQHKVLLHLIEMVQKNGLEYGRSILSVVLFFFPRALWEGKPIVLGQQVGKDLFGNGFVGTANLSGPIFGDFYYDFGILGVIVGSVATAYLFRKLLMFGETLNGIPAIGLFYLGAMPILFRGSVGAVIAISFFTLFFYYLLIFVQNRIRWSTQ